MRTTLVIPDPIFQRSRREADRRGCSLSEFFAEAAEEKLVRRKTLVSEKRAKYRVKAVAMGKPKADISDREQLYRAMEE